MQRLGVRLDQLAAEHLVAAHATVVAALRRREALVRPAQRPVALEERVLLLHAEPGLLRGVLLGHLPQRRARVAPVRAAVRVHHLAQHQDVVRPRRSGFGDVAHRPQQQVALLALRLVGARAVEAPDPAARRRSGPPRPGPSSSSAASRSASARRPRCTPPSPCAFHSSKRALTGPVLSVAPRGPHARTLLQMRCQRPPRRGVSTETLEMAGPGRPAPLEGGSRDSDNFVGDAAGFLRNCRKLRPMPRETGCPRGRLDGATAHPVPSPRLSRDRNPTHASPSHGGSGHASPACLLSRAGTNRPTIS